MTNRISKPHDGTKAGPKRLSKGQRKHIRRLKQAARKTGTGKVTRGTENTQ